MAHIPPYATYSLLQHSKPQLLTSVTNTATQADLMRHYLRQYCSYQLHLLTSTMGMLDSTNRANLKSNLFDNLDHIFILKFMFLTKQKQRYIIVKDISFQWSMHTQYGVNQALAERMASRSRVQNLPCLLFEAWASHLIPKQVHCSRENDTP